MDDESDARGVGAAMTRSESTTEGAPDETEASTAESDKKKVADAWEQGLDSTEVIDDPVRTYLREIGRVSLLKAAEERVLA